MLFRSQRSRATEQALDGLPLSQDHIAQALVALRAELQPEADLTHSVATKQHLTGVLLKRALQTLSAPRHAGGSTPAA